MKLRCPYDNNNNVVPHLHSITMTCSLQASGQLWCLIYSALNSFRLINLWPHIHLRHFRDWLLLLSRNNAPYRRGIFLVLFVVYFFSKLHFVRLQEVYYGGTMPLALFINNTSLHGPYALNGVVKKCQSIDKTILPVQLNHDGQH